MLLKIIIGNTPIFHVSRDFVINIYVYMSKPQLQLNDDSVCFIDIELPQAYLLLELWNINIFKVVTYYYLFLVWDILSYTMH